MASRDEYLEKFKAKLDEWNAEIDRLEAIARAAQAEMQAEYQEQLDALRRTRDEALKEYDRVQNATVDAWDAMVQGTEKAWQVWADAFDKARSKLKS